MNDSHLVHGLDYTGGVLVVAGVYWWFGLGSALVVAGLLVMVKASALSESKEY